MFIREDENCTTEDLQRAIELEFIAEPYSGPVLALSPGDAVNSSDVDNLETYFQGKSWRDVDEDFIVFNHDDYVLMNERAVPAFFGAWLWRAAQNPDLSNPVMASLIFHLATFGGSSQKGAGVWGRGFKGLSRGQGHVIKRLLKCAAENCEEREDLADIETAIAGVDLNLGL